MAENGKISVDPGDQACISLGFTPRSINIQNIDSQKPTTVRYAWIYNDPALIATPATANPPDVEINPNGARTIEPVQNGQVNPATFVFYNQGPATCNVETL